MLQHFDREKLIWEAAVKPTQKLLLLALNSFVDGNGQCWPGYERLAAMCGASVDTIQRTAKQLESMGILAIFRRRAQGRQTSNLYSVKFENLRAAKCGPEPPEPQNAAQPEPQNAAQPEPQNAARSTHRDLLSKDLPRSSSSSDRNLQDREPTTTTPDPFFGKRNSRRIRMITSPVPAWDANAPWADDGQRLAFDGWLRQKYAAKTSPARYAATIVRSAARGEPCVDWDEFVEGASSQTETAAIAAWGKRTDWENFPLLTEWERRYDELGWMNFTNQGGRYSAQHRFADWTRERRRLVV